MPRPIKRSFSLKGHRTSISIEPAFWDILQQASRDEGISLAALVSRIDDARDPENSGLSSSVRLWILEYCCTRRN